MNVNIEDIVVFFALIQLLPARSNCVNNLATLLPARAYEIPLYTKKKVYQCGVHIKMSEKQIPEV